jgi:hypothetical protein
MGAFPGAAGPVDVRAMQARSLVERLAQGAGGGPDQPGAGGPDAAGGQLSQQLSELKGADPQLMSKATEQIKAMLLAIQVRMAFQVPEAARHAAQAQKSIDGMLKALQQATAAANTIQQPIVNQAGVSSPAMGPSMGAQQVPPQAIPGAGEGIGG